MGKFSLSYFQGGFTALHLAAQEGYKGIVKMLLDAGASEKIVNNVSSLVYCTRRFCR